MRRPELAARSSIYDLDHVLLTSRNQDAVFIVDWRREELVWAWGPGELSGPHGGTVLEDGRILIFDNGLGREWSRIVEIDPLSGEIVWEYRAPIRRTSTRATAAQSSGSTTATR